MGFDPNERSIGAAVASKYLAVGAIVPAVSLEAGAIATQAYTNAGFRDAGISLLREGLAPESVVSRLLRSDPAPELRQVGIVSADGESFSSTGRGVSPHCGSLFGRGFAIQGNYLAFDEVLDSMHSAWLETAGLLLEERLLAALEAGDRAGGDARGRQSAAIAVARPAADFVLGSMIDTDLRVDDSDAPLADLRRLLDLRWRMK